MWVSSSLEKGTLIAYSAAAIMAYAVAGCFVFMVYFPGCKLFLSIRHPCCEKKQMLYSPILFQGGILHCVLVNMWRRLSIFHDYFPAILGFV